MSRVKKSKKSKKVRALPESFRPLLWSMEWDRVNISKDKEDIIVNTVNDGSLEQWRWLADTYGKEVIRKVLSKRLETEFHSESRNLARVVFGVNHFSHARRSTRASRTKNLSAPRSV